MKSINTLNCGSYIKIKGNMLVGPSPNSDPKVLFYLAIVQLNNFALKIQPKHISGISVRSAPSPAKGIMIILCANFAGEGWGEGFYLLSHETKYQDLRKHSVYSENFIWYIIKAGWG